MRRSGDAAAATALAAGLCLIAFLTTAGEEGGLGPNTWTEVALVLIGGGLAIWMLAAGRPGPAWGAPAVALFGALAVLTALSIAWSVQPDQSWIEAGRTFAYLATFAAGAILARLLPARWPAAAGGVAIAATAIAGWAVLAKAFTLQTQMQPTYGRLLVPFDYWNATGLIAAMGLPPALWAAARRGGPRLIPALAVPAIALLITVVVLSYSRSAALAAVIGTAVPLAFGLVRLRGVLMLAVGGAGAAVICGWALSDTSLTGDSPEWGGTVLHGARVSAGHTFGIVVLVVLMALAAAGYLAAVRADRARLSGERRRRIGTAVAGGFAVLVPVLAVLALAASSRGLTGEVSHLWNTLTSTNGTVGNSASRLLSTANSRPAYWRQGWAVGTHHLLAGAGAGSFGVAHLRYPENVLISSVPQAHSYVIETFADLGLIGAALNLALLLAWGRAVRQTFGSWQDPERDGLVALLGAVVAYGVSSAIDWTWFIPGVTVPALFGAGWLAGRGPLGQTVGLRAARERRRLLARPVTVGATTAIAVACLALSYAVWQPLRSHDADAAATSAALGGRLGAALTDARSAVAYFPVSLQAIDQLGELQAAAGDRAGGEAELVHGTRVQPENPWSWDALGIFQLRQHEYRRAFDTLNRASALDYHYPWINYDVHVAALHMQ